jgi:tRNA uridine 5-carboxymethylaminomethyl modification enzyme
VEAEINRLTETLVYPKDANAFLESVGSAPLKNRCSLAELIKRPEVTYENLAAIDGDRPELSSHALAQLEVQIKYEGYITKQEQKIERFKKLEDKKLDQDFNYDEVEGLRIEARQKLNQFKPVSMGQASRISGVSPADINVLLIHLEKMRRKK